MTNKLAEVFQLIGAYGLQCSQTGELAPTRELIEAVEALSAHDRRGWQPGVVYVNVSGLTGTGKSAICGEIEILCKALGVPVEWPGGQQERNLTHADWTSALEMYQPRVVIIETNIPRAPAPTDTPDAKEG